MAEPISNLPTGSKSLANQLFIDPNNNIYVGKDSYYELGGLDGDLVFVGDNLSTLNNDVGYIANGTGGSQVRNNTDLDARYLRTETDPSVGAHIKSITTQNISNWDAKLEDVTAGANITIDRTNPQKPVISAVVPSPGLTSITLTGNVTGSGGPSIVTTIAANAVVTSKIEDKAVTLAKIQNIGRGSVLGLASGGTNTWTLLTPSHGTYTNEWRPNFHASVGFLVSYENKLYKVLTNADPVPPPTNPSQYQLIHSNFRRFTYGVTYTPGMLVVMGGATSNYYTTSANITNIAPTDTPTNTPSSPQELTVGDGLIVTAAGVLRTTGAEAITGLISAGSNISIAGAGTPASPYIIAATGGGGGGGSSTLAGLTDVNVSGVSNGQTLVYNSGTWLPGSSSVPNATASVYGIVKLGNATIQSVAANTASSVTGRTYPIQVNSSGQTVVNVPWTSGSGGGDFQLRSNTNAYLTGSVSLIAGTNVTLSQSGQNITINASGGGGGSADLVTAGSSTIGAVRYAGVTKTNGQWYGGVSNPTNVTRLNYDGIIHSGGMVTYGTSDINLKTDLVKIGDALEILSNISGYSFTWKDNENYKGKDYGLIAQEVESIFPEVVSTIGNYKAIKSGNQIIALLVEAVKELNDKVNKLEYGI